MPCERGRAGDDDEAGGPRDRGRHAGRRETTIRRRRGRAKKRAGRGGARVHEPPLGGRHVTRRATARRAPAHLGARAPAALSCAVSLTWTPPPPPPPPSSSRARPSPLTCVHGRLLPWLPLLLLLALSSLWCLPCCSSSCRRGEQEGRRKGHPSRSPSPPLLMGFAGEGSPVSGGGFSENGKFSFGYASSPGKRSSMEDFHETRVDGVDGETVGLFGVFDGHGGARAAEFVKQNLFTNLINHPKFISDTKSAIAETYTHTDSEFLKADTSHHRDAGSTASTAILVGDRLLVANVGDSRAVICRGGDAIAVSRDHKPDQTDERQRIEEAGGFVMWAGTWRVGGVLAVSRAFGDKLLKQYVVADPEIKEEVVDSSLEFLILASDGLWDVVTNEEAVAMVKPILDSEQAAKKLLQEASQRGSADNITCVVVRFLEQQNGLGRATNEQAS